MINSFINHDKFFQINNVLTEYNKMKQQIKNLENALGYTIQKQWKHIVSLVKKILGIITLILEEQNKID